MTEEQMDALDNIRYMQHWFDGYYTIHEQKYNRMIRLNDTTENWFEKLQELDELAEEKRDRIKELEELIKGGL